MGELAVAFAPADRDAAQDVVAALQAKGLKARAAPLSAGRANHKAAPAVVVWSRHAAADARLRALIKRARPPVLARIDAAPTPRTSAALVDLRQRGWEARWPTAEPAPKNIHVARANAAPVASPTTAIASAPEKKRGGALGLIVVCVVLAAAAGGYAAYAGGYLEPLIAAATPGG